MPRHLPRKPPSRFHLERLEDRRLLSFALDPTFSGDGWATVDFFGRDDSASAVAVQPAANPQGYKVLLAGTARDGSDPADWGIARLNPDGSLDSGFGTNGKVLTRVGNKSDAATTILVNADGSFYVVGSTDKTKGGFDYDKDQAIGLARYKADGSLDTKFGSKGIVVTNLTSVNDVPTHARLDAQGRIVVVGWINQPGPSTFAVRYNPNGTLDTTFGSGGKYVGTQGGVNDFVIHADGSMTLTSNVRLVRLNASGQLVGSFGTGGVVDIQAATGATEIKRLVQQGSRLIVGENYTGRLFAFDAASGAFDSTYDVELTTLLPTPPEGAFWGYSDKPELEVDAANRLLVFTKVSLWIPVAPGEYRGELRLAAFRLLADGTLDTSSAIDLDPTRSDEDCYFPAPFDGASHVTLVNPADPNSDVLMAGRMDRNFLAVRMKTDVAEAVTTRSASFSEIATPTWVAADPAGPFGLTATEPKRLKRARPVLGRSS